MRSTAISLLFLMLMLVAAPISPASAQDKTKPSPDQPAAAKKFESKKFPFDDQLHKDCRFDGLLQVADNEGRVSFMGTVINTAKDKRRTVTVTWEFLSPAGTLVQQFRYTYPDLEPMEKKSLAENAQSEEIGTFFDQIDRGRLILQCQ